jgi:uncharacterized membrane protein
LQLFLSAKIYLILSIAGLVDALYHAYDEITENFGQCNLSPTISCQGVFESGHTSIFGIPFFVLGLVWFPLAIIVGLYAFSRGGSDSTFSGKILVPFLLIGDIFTLYLWYVELGIIHVVCPVCVSIYVINYLMTILTAKMLY